MARKTRAAAVLMAALVALAGCGQASSDSGSGQSEPGKVNRAATPAPQAYEKAEALLKPNETAEAARHRFIAACVREAGEVAPPVNERSVSVRSLAQLTPLTVDGARSAGYAKKQGLSAESAAAGGQAPSFRGDESGGTVSARLLGGRGSVFKNGCLAKSYEAVYGSVEDGMRVTGLIENALLQPVQSARDTQQYRKLVEEWAVCMKGKGINAESPDLLEHEALNVRKSPDKETAVKDAECRGQVKFEERLKVEIAAVLTPFLEEHEKELAALGEIKRRGEQNAAKIK
ncbi:hypothetical protein GCM10009595_10190 [Falsarthrobacter nasiphocae]